MGDAVVGAVCAVGAIWAMSLAGNLASVPDSPALWVAPVGMAGAWVLWLSFGRAYEWHLFGEGVEEYRRVAVAGLVAVGAVGVISAVAQLANGRIWVIGLLVVTFLTLVWRRALRGSLHRWRRRGRGMNRAILVGPTEAVEATAELVAKNPFHGTKVVGALIPADDPAVNREDVPEFACGGDIAEAVDRFDADEVILLRSVDLGSVEMRDLMWALAERRVSLVIQPLSLHVSGPRFSTRPIDGMPLLEVAHPQISGLSRAVKGALDRTLAALGLLILAPALLLIATLVAVEDRGPVFYRQRRVGEDGRHFSMLKFRSMHVDADKRLEEVAALNVHPDGVHIAIKNDPRVTNVGRFLRKYSLDELPQLINVVKGDMALVGPRPPLPVEVEAYPEHGLLRMTVRPGLTGLWQIKGPERHFLSLDEALELDLRYVENWSLAYDWAILWRTIGVVLRGSGEVKDHKSTESAVSLVLPASPRPAVDTP